MMYWLLLLIGLYAALASTIWQHHPRSISNAILAVYIALAAVFAAGLLIVGTTAEHATAEVGGFLVMAASGWLHWLVLPLALTGLLFESWLRAHWRAIVMVTGAIGVAILAIVAMGSPVEIEAGRNALQCPLRGVCDTPGVAALGIFTSQVGLWIVAFLGWRHGRIALWFEAVPLMVAALVAALLPIVVEWVPVQRQIGLLALSSMPPVLALASVVLVNSRRVARAAWLEHELAHLSEAALVIDSDQHVIWQNAAALRWLGGSPPGAMTARHLADVIVPAELQDMLSRMLAELIPAAELRVEMNHEDLVLLVANQPLEAAANLPNARLITLSDMTASRIRRDLQERSRELLALSRVSSDIASSLDVTQVVAHALNQIVTLFPADWVLIYLTDQDNPQVLRLIDEVHQNGATALFPAVIDLRNQSELHAIVGGGEPVYVADANESPYASQLAALSIQSAAVIPARASDYLTCALIMAYRAPHSYDAVECAILESIGQQVAVAVRNARLHERERRQRQIAETLSQVAGVLGNVNLTTALQDLLARLSRLVAFECATVMLNDSPGWLRIAAAEGLIETESPDVLTEMRIEINAYHYLRQLLEHGAPQLVSDTRTAPFWGAKGCTIGSWIGVPLIVRQQVLGCFSLTHSQPGFFSDDDLQMASTFAAQAAIAVENAQLFQREQQRREQAELLYQVSHNLVTSADLDSALRGVLVDLARICPFDRAHIGLLNANGTTWVPRAIYPTDAAPPRDGVVPVESYPLIEQVITTRQSLLVNDTRQHPLWKAGHSELHEVRSWLGIPLVVRDRIVGIFNIDSFSPNQFTEECLRIVHTFSVQVSGVVEMFRLLEEADRRLGHLRLVNEVGRYTAAILRVRTLIDSVAARLFSRLGYHQISLTQVEGGELSVLAVYINGSYVQPANDGYPAPCVNTQRAYEQAVPIWVQADPTAASQPDSRHTKGTSSILAVPMILADEVIGVLTVERRSPQFISQEDIDLLEPLSAQLAISVSNARLFEKVRQQALEQERRVIERTHQIRQQQEHTEAILSSVADAVIVLDLHGQVIKVNRAARELFEHYDLEINLGAHITALVERAQAQETSGESEIGSLFTEEIEVGAIVLQAKAARVRAGDELLGTVIVLRDISALKELDRTRDTFVSHVSHELRTPLANVKLYLSLLEKGRPERRADYLGVIQTEIDRLERLITDLLQLSRLRAEYHGEREPVRDVIQMDALIQQVLDANSARAEEQNKHLTYEPQSGPLPQLVGNADHLVRALTNLIGNAISYTPEGGSIVVRSKVVQRGEHASSEWVMIEVSDTGLGIPSDELPMIFDRFYRGSNVRTSIPGTGLGLAIIKEIVELHGGTIEVDSELGRGSTFKLALPVGLVEELEGVAEQHGENNDLSG